MSRSPHNIPRSDEHVGEQLSAYIDNALDKVEGKRIRAHLRACSDCRAAYVELIAAQRLLRNLPGMMLPRTFTLTPSMLGEKPSFLSRIFAPRLEPAFATASVLSFALLLLVLVGDILGAPVSTPAVGTTAATAPSSALMQSQDQSTRSATEAAPPAALKVSPAESSTTAALQAAAPAPTQVAGAGGGAAGTLPSIAGGTPDVANSQAAGSAPVASSQQSLPEQPTTAGARAPSPAGSVEAGRMASLKLEVTLAAAGMALALAAFIARRRPF